MGLHFYDVEYFGGVVLFTIEQFEKVNGYHTIGVGVWKMMIYFGDVI